MLLIAQLLSHRWLLPSSRVPFWLSAFCLVLSIGCSDASKEMARVPFVEPSKPIQTNAYKVVIGMQLPITGRYAQLGAQARIGVEAALADANVPPMQFDGKTVEFVISTEDDQGQANAARLAAGHLVEENVWGVVGPLVTEAGIASAPVYARANIPTISPSIADTAFAKAGGSSTFTLAAGYDQQAKAMVNFLVGTLQTKQLLLLLDQDPINATLTDAIRVQLKKTSKITHSSLSINPQALELAAIVKAIKKSAPQAIVFMGPAQTAGQLAQAMADAKLEMPLVGSVAMHHPDFFKSFKASGIAHYAVTVEPDLTALLPKVGQTSQLFKSATRVSVPTQNGYAAAGLLIKTWKDRPEARDQRISGLMGGTAAVSDGKDDAAFDDKKSWRTQRVMVYKALGGQWGDGG